MRDELKNAIQNNESFAGVQAAWLPPSKLKPSEWTELNRIIPASMSAEPGKWTWRNPYLKGIMDAVVEPGVEEVVFLKAVQVGFSECLRNLMGYWIDVDAGPLLVVMPDQKSGEEFVNERLRPTLESTPALKRHQSERAWDNTLTVVKLSTMPIYVGWAGSVQSLATRPCRYVVFDEIDKPNYTQTPQGDPIALGTKRTETYLHRARIIKGSTPTTRTGNVWRAWEACGDKRHYHVPCPHCHKFQALSFPQIKWSKHDEDKIRLADQVEREKLAWYECRFCDGRISDKHKPLMLAKGVWVSEGQSRHRSHV